MSAKIQKTILRATVMIAKAMEMLKPLTVEADAAAAPAAKTARGAKAAVAETPVKRTRKAAAEVVETPKRGRKAAAEVVEAPSGISL